MYIRIKKPNYKVGFFTFSNTMKINKKSEFILAYQEFLLIYWRKIDS